MALSPQRLGMRLEDALEEPSANVLSHLKIQPTEHMGNGLWWTAPTPLATGVWIGWYTGIICHANKDSQFALPKDKS